MIAQDKRPTWAPQHIDEAVRFLGQICKDNGVNLDDLRRAFPNRPKNRDEVKAIMTWIDQYIKAAKATAARLSAPSRSSSPQYDTVAPLEENGKAKRWHYALRDEVEGTVKFYRVKRGYKPGFFFVDVQASDEYYPIKNRAHKEAILKAIAKDARAALALYGQELGSCGRCGRTLTSEYRELGIGPVCINK